ncbi:RelB antitoxin [Opitutaceae bacterium TAV1]|nr:RelB antitoxin [Opitutaceae bacterium TAV1]
MPRTATEQIRIRVPVSRARKVRAILDNLGTDTGSLVNMLFAQVEMKRRIPFAVTETDQETEEILNDPGAMKAINEHRRGKKDRLQGMKEVFG